MTIEEAQTQLASVRSCAEIMDPLVYERALRVAHHEEADRVPIWDFIDSWELFQTLAPGVEDPVQATARVYHTLAIDFCRAIHRPRAPGEEGIYSESADWAIKVSGRTTWKIRRPINNLSDLQHFVAQLPPPPSPEECLPTVATIAQWRDILAPHTFYVPGHGVGFHAAYDLMGLQLFSVLLYDAPQEIQALIEYHNAVAVAHCQAFARARLSPFFFIGDDIAYKNKLMFSPKTLRQLFFPYLRRMCEILNPAGYKVIFHSDGDITSILPDLIACGVAGINPLETAAGMDIAYIKREFGRDLILVGGVDCSQILPLGTPQIIRQEVQRVLRAGAKGGGMFIGSSSEIVPSTPLENIFAFYDACKEFGRYPIQ